MRVTRPVTLNRRNTVFAGVALILLFSRPALSASGDVDPSTLDRKVLLGYQGWFTCPEDGSQRWTHWSRGVPAPATLRVDLYPDLSELDADERCEVPGMTIGGKPAYLFSSRNPKTVSRHFRWMKEYGLDGVLVQRFVGSVRGRRAEGDTVLKNVMAAARESGRTFAIEYDISGGQPETFAQILQEDWAYLVRKLKVTSHPNYLHHNGKPVLSVWGMGLDEPGHPPTDPQAAKDLIEWFKSKAPEEYQVTYMGGTPSRWGTLTADSHKDPAWAGVYAMMDVVQPWTVGRYRTLEAVDKWKEDMLVPDLKLTAANHQIYMPVVFPGFSWHNLKKDAKAKENQIPRLRGEFLWRQAYNAKMAGATVLKIAMFDEVDEGTAVLKVVSHRSEAPDQGFWLTLDADGAELPSDWYLRLAGEITRMFHGEVKPDPELPTSPGPPSKPAARQKEPADYENPDIGTIGNLLTATIPYAQYPHGIAGVAPVTTPGIQDRYLADKIFGFPAGPATLMAYTGDVTSDPARSASRYDHGFETATPYWYKVRLEDSIVWAEATATRLAAYCRFTFPATRNAHLDLNLRRGEVEVVGPASVSGSGKTAERCPPGTSGAAPEAAPPSMSR